MVVGSTWKDKYQKNTRTYIIMDIYLEFFDKDNWWIKFYDVEGRGHQRVTEKSFLKMFKKIKE
jgi:hypothetical protein